MFMSKIPKSLSYLFHLAAALLFLYLTFLMINFISLSLEGLSPYLNAPRIIAEENLSGQENRIVWLYGRLISRTGDEALFGPVSEKKCLYYRYEKLRASWETDSDGDSSKVWYVIEHDEKVLVFSLQIGNQKIEIDQRNIEYYGLGQTADSYETIDQIEYNYREYSLPFENAVWIMGKLENGKIVATNRGVAVCLSAIEPYLASLKSQTGGLIYFSILFGILGMGLACGFVYRILGNKIKFIHKGDFAIAFIVPVYFWFFAGTLLVILTGESLIGGIFMGITVNVMFILPLASHKCRGRLGPAAVFFIPSVTLFIFGFYFLYNAFISLEARLFPLAAGLLLVAGAIALVYLYRFVIARIRLPAVG
jgi:hypothetical protein